MEFSQMLLSLARLTNLANIPRTFCHIPDIRPRRNQKHAIPTKCSTAESLLRTSTKYRYKMSTEEERFPCALTIDIPLPDHRLASTALRALQVDAELSPLVHRTFTLISSLTSSTGASSADGDVLELNVLRTEYRATTNRMLRVSVNGFFESLGVVLQVMQELDIDVLAAKAQLQSQPQSQI